MTIHIGNLWLELEPYWARSYRTGQSAFVMLGVEWALMHNRDLTSTHVTVALLGVGLWFEVDWYHVKKGG